jgi:hypothetical protein
MNNNISLEILKYLDCYGTHFNFYTERNRKFYTPLGGILTLLSIFFGLIVFTSINLDDFLHNNPISTTSIAKDKIRLIKSGEEKIWIPWRIRDFGGKTVNHTDLFYPIIYYYKAKRNHTLKAMETSYKFINYKLCNETSMKNNSEYFMLDIELDQLYCIDMEDLYIGGGWDAEYLYLITLDLYICKNGINYDEHNKNCSTYEEIIRRASDNNCFEFEIYYPVVHYQPMNKTNPLFVKYTNNFYHLSRYSNKISRLYLEQYILNDDTGWVLKNEKIVSYWGINTLNGDSYATGSQRDIMNEGSSSRLYSFNIYLKSDIVYYTRSYRKLFLIIADGLPIINIIFIFFKIIAKIFKVSSGNKKLTELLFENLQKKKPLKFKDEKFNLLKLNSKKHHSDKKLNLTFKKKENSIIKKNSKDFSLIPLTQHESEKKLIFSTIDNRKDSSDVKNNKGKNKNQVNNPNKNILNKTFNNIFNLNYYNNGFNNNINNNMHNNLEIFFSNKSNDISKKLLNKKNNKKNHNNLEENHLIYNNNNNNINQIQNQNQNQKPNIQYVKKTLFPYKYYLCSIFIKNIDISKQSFFFTKKFIVVYNFICQLFDISSYLILQREFEIMKNTIMVGKYREILENRQKINVNDHFFNINMKECLDRHKFSILGKIKHTKV